MKKYHCKRSENTGREIYGQPAEPSVLKEVDFIHPPLSPLY